MHGLDLISVPMSLDALRELCQVDFIVLHELQIRWGSLGAPGIEILIQAKLCQDLETLRLGYNSFGGAGLELLADTPQFPQVRRLDVQGNGVSDSAMRSLTHSPRWGALIELTASANELSGEAVEALASSPNCTALRSLDLAANRLGVRACTALAGSAALKNLDAVDLGYCRLSPPAVAALVGRAHRRWRSLGLAGNRIGDEAAKLLAQSPSLAGLKFLDLRDCDLTPWGLKDLMWSPQLTELRSLYVGNQGFDARCWQVLATCPRHSHLHDLRVWANEFSPEELGQFGHGARFPALRHLGLLGPALTGEALTSLVDTPLMDQLVLLHVGSQAITAEVLARLLASPKAARLQALVPDGEIDQEARALLDTRFFAHYH
jgi:hypothetical protein